MRTVACVAGFMLLAALVSASDMCDEQVLFDVGDGTIEIGHLQSPYNCCAWIGFEVYQEGLTISVEEWEHYEPPGGCDCICCFDMRVLIGGLEPGEYTVTLTKHYEEGEAVVLGPWQVTVDGTSDPLLITTYQPCAETQVGDETETSWSVLKSLYR